MKSGRNFAFVALAMTALPLGAQDSSDPLAAMSAREIGPAGMSGRVADVEVVLSDPNIIARAAYVADEFGVPEVYVRSFPDGEDRVRVSNGGGTEPVWAPDGSAVYYRNGSSVMSASITPGALFSVDAPQEIFEYTVGAQVTSAFDFDRAVRAALRELGADILILLGPGMQLGGAIGQILCLEGFFGVHQKKDFTERQQGEDKVLLSLGLDDQLALARAPRKTPGGQPAPEEHREDRQPTTAQRRRWRQAH